MCAVENSKFSDSGIVIDIGSDSTIITSLFHGTLLRENSFHHHFGGMNIDKKIKSYFQDRFDGNFGLDLIRKIKEEKLSFDNEKVDTKIQISENETLDLPLQIFDSHEILFHSKTLRPLLFINSNQKNSE